MTLESFHAQIANKNGKFLKEEIGRPSILRFFKMTFSEAYLTIMSWIHVNLIRILFPNYEQNFINFGWAVLDMLIKFAFFWDNPRT